MEKYHVAIVGGGIAGLYAAWRLRHAWKSQPAKLREWLGIANDQRRLDVVILERNPIVLGGRIRTADLPFPGGSVRAELGAMRITKRHLLARNLLSELEIETVPFEGEGFSEHYFLRGKHFDPGDVESEDPAIFPYTLEALHGKKKKPGDLVEYVFEQALRELSLDRHATPDALLVLEKLRSKAARETLTHEEWLLIQKHGLLTGIVELSNLGVLNLLHHYLSPEAASFVDGGLGYESVIGNWNVSDAIPWFIADFSPGQGYESIVGSMFEVVEKIEQALQTDYRFRCDIYRNARVTRLEQPGERSYRVLMDKKQTPYKNKPAVPASVTADAVFLALPRRPLESLQIEWLEKKSATGKLREWNESLASVRGHRLAKIVQAYRYPWWRQDRSQRGTASRTFTDLPLRQVYYLDREWLEERGRYRNEAGEIAPGTTPEVGGMIVAYLDGHYTSFWRFITAVQRLHDLHGSDGLDKKKAILKEQEKRRFFGGRIRAWPEPPNLDNLFDRALFDKKAPWTRHDRALHLYYYRYGLYERAAAKVKHALESLHKPAPRWAGAKVLEPVAGAYTFWDDFSDDALVGSGWHTWESGVSSAGIIEKMVCPFEKEKKKVYVCGEAYSSDQGWIEGALKSVELIMARLGILLPGETTDANAREDVQARAARMRDHVGLRPRMKHTPLLSGNYPVRLGDGSVMVFLSGKIGFEPPAPPRDTTFAHEAREALKKLLEELKKADGAPCDLVSVRAFLRTMDDYDDFNGIYNEVLERAGGTAPVRTAIAVHDLPFGARVEVDGIAVVKKKGSQ